MTYHHVIAALALATGLIACGSPKAPTTTPPIKNGKWTQLISGMDPHAPIYVLANNGTNLYASTGVAKKSFYVSTNAGSSWTNASAGLVLSDGSDAAVTAFAVSGNTIFAGAGWMWRSDNDGKSWATVSDGPVNTTTGTVYTAMSVFANDILAGPTFNIVVSHNGGLNWNTTNFAGGGVPIAFASFNNKYFAGTQYGHSVSVSTDRGDNWTDAATNPPLDAFNNPVSVGAFGVHGNTLFAGTGGSGVYKSADTGVTWTATNNGLVTKDLLSPTSAYSFAVSGNTIYVGTDSGVYVTTDDGSNWKALDRTDLPDANRAFSMTILGNKLYIGTYTDGVWSHDLL